LLRAARFGRAHVPFLHVLRLSPAVEADRQTAAFICALRFVRAKLTQQLKIIERWWDVRYDPRHFAFEGVRNPLDTYDAAFSETLHIARVLSADHRVAVEMLAQASYLTTIPQLEHVELSASQISNALRELSQVQYAFFEVGQYWTEFMREAERFERGVRDKAEQLGSYGWTVPLEASLPDTLSILERSINAEAADVTFVDFYAADGNAAYTSLKTELLSRAELEPWREDLTAAYERFAFDDYLSCVNNLLPVFDGFGAAKLREPRFHEKKARDRFFARKIGTRKNSLLDEALWRSVKAFVDCLFEPVDFPDHNQLGRRLNRNARLHGRGSYRPNRPDCLRLLQALHTVLFL
jgi:hypothetical protein